MTIAQAIAEFAAAIPNMHRPALNRARVENDGTMTLDPNGTMIFGGCKYLANTGEKCWIGQLLLTPVDEKLGPIEALESGGRTDIAHPSDLAEDKAYRWLRFINNLQSWHDAYRGSPGAEFQAYLRTGLDEICERCRFPKHNWETSAALEALVTGVTIEHTH